MPLRVAFHSNARVIEPWPRHGPSRRHLRRDAPAADETRHAPTNGGPADHASGRAPRMDRNGRRIRPSHLAESVEVAAADRQRLLTAFQVNGGRLVTARDVADRSQGDHDRSMYLREPGGIELGDG